MARLGEIVIFPPATNLTLPPSPVLLKLLKELESTFAAWISPFLAMTCISPPLPALPGLLKLLESRVSKLISPPSDLMVILPPLPSILSKVSVFRAPIRILPVAISLTAPPFPISDIEKESIKPVSIFSPAIIFIAPPSPLPLPSLIFVVKTEAVEFRLPVCIELLERSVILPPRPFFFAKEEESISSTRIFSPAVRVIFPPFP